MDSKRSPAENITSLARNLLGASRSALLGTLLLRPEEELHVRELARIARMSAGTIHRELRALAELGLLLRREAGRQVFYRANRDSPVYPDLVGFLRKTVGVGEILRAALAPLRQRIRLAFVHGVAAGEEEGADPLQVLVLGEVSPARVTRALEPTAALLGREVNALVLTPEGFEQRRQAGDDIVVAALAGPRLLLLGSLEELGAGGDGDARARRSATSAEVARELRDIRRNLEAAARSAVKDE